MQGSQATEGWPSLQEEVVQLGQASPPALFLWDRPAEVHVLREVAADASGRYLQTVLGRALSMAAAPGTWNAWHSSRSIAWKLARNTCS